MKIMHLSAADVYGGGEEHIRTVMVAMQSQIREGEELLMACPEHAPLYGKLKDSGVTMVPFEFGGKKDPFAPLRLRKFVNENQIDVVHSHNRREDLAAIIGGGAAQVWTTLHDRLNMTQSGERSDTIFDRVYVKILPRFDRLLAVSQATLDDYQELTGDQRDSNVTITNGMDLSRCENVSVIENFRKTHNIENEALMIGLSARVRNGSFGKKGHLRLLDILKELTIPVHLVTMGEDKASAKLLKEEAATRGVPITCMGFQDNALEVMNTVDVVVLPSLFEGLPRALMEAMALGKAVVGSEVDGIAALTNNGTVGLLAGVEDYGQWREHLTSLADKGRREALGQSAADYIRSTYDSQQMAAEHWELYRSLT